MKRLCLIGDPIGHSLSPAIHQYLMARTGVAGSYAIHPVKPGELSDFVAAARNGAWDGCNVTMPHKKAILPLLDDLTEEARYSGAVNTVRFAQGRAVGHNTDGQGFLDSLPDGAVQGKTALILGCGGAAEAVTAALVRSGAERVLLWNRHVQRAGELAERFPGQAAVAEEITAAAGQSQLIVNATPLGMAGGADFTDFSFLDDTAALVYDLVYHPRKTKLLQEAQRRGLPTVGGIELLIAQAIRAFSFFTSEQVDRRQMAQEIRERGGLNEE